MDKLEAMGYLSRPCPFRIGSEERILVQQLRVLYIRSVNYPGDCLEMVPGYEGAVKLVDYVPRAGTIHGSRRELSE